MELARRIQIRKMSSILFYSALNSAFQIAYFSEVFLIPSGIVLIAGSVAIGAVVFYLIGMILIRNPLEDTLEFKIGIYENLMLWSFLFTLILVAFLIPDARQNLFAFLIGTSITFTILVICSIKILQIKSP